MATDSVIAPALPVAVDLPMVDGDLHVRVWEASGPDVLALHGLAATSGCWLRVAHGLGESARVIAPDLRGRGGSRRLPGPFGLAAHLDDLRIVVERLATGPVTVVGHSMGAVLALELAAAEPALVESLVLVDGGLEPDVLGRSLSPSGLLAAGLSRRLGRRFADRSSYHQVVRLHPAYERWDPWIQAILDDELVDLEPGVRLSCNARAIETDVADLVDRLRCARQVWPIVSSCLLAAGHGLDSCRPGLYDPSIDALRSRRGVEVTRLPDEHHYGILVSPSGASAVAAAIRGQLGAGRPRWTGRAEAAARSSRRRARTVAAAPRTASLPRALSTTAATT